MFSREFTYLKKMSERIYNKLNSRLHLRGGEIWGRRDTFFYGIELNICFVLFKKYLKYVEMHREPYKESELPKDRKSLEGHAFCKSFLSLSIYDVDEAIEALV